MRAFDGRGRGVGAERRALSLLQDTQDPVKAEVRFEEGSRLPFAQVSVWTARGLLVLDRARAPTREPLVVPSPRAFDLVNLARTAGSHGEPHAARASARGDLGVRAPAVTPSPRVVILRDSSPPIL